MDLTDTQTEADTGRRFVVGGLSSLALHILAMALMLLDHLWGTIVAGQDWMTWLGRISYPLFAFLIVEGYFHTSNYKRYLLRILIFAVLSEIPFNMMYSSYWIFPYHQNVLWTFLLALLCLKVLDKTRARCREKAKPWLGILLSVPWVLLFALLSVVVMADYNIYGVLMVVLFYFVRGQRWYHRLGQLAGMVYINWFMMGGLVVPLELLGMSVEIPQQGVAVFALLPIWLYRGRQGCHNKYVQYSFYAFYPVHMLILGILNILY